MVINPIFGVYPIFQTNIFKTQEWRCNIMTIGARVGAVLSFVICTWGHNPLNNMEMDQNLFCHMLLGNEHPLALFLCSPGAPFIFHDYSRNVKHELINPKGLFNWGDHL